MDANTQKRRFVLYICALLLVNIQVAWTGGQVEIQFVRYQDNCIEHLIFYCEPYFTFCLTRPSASSPSVTNCAYGRTGPTRHFHGTNDIQLSDLTNLGNGVRNPWIIPMDGFDGNSVQLVVRVDESDYFDDDHLVTWGSVFSESVYPTKEESQWTDRTMLTAGPHRLDFRIRMYCLENYYTSTCQVYCKPQDSYSGHYTCEKNTGRKICLKGWTGADCDQDINECYRRVCARGRCTNSPGDYRCDCPEHYSGKNCELVDDACESDPCQHRGMCYSHRERHDYTCVCTEDYEGKNCELLKDPCRKRPCINNGICLPSADHRTYQCQNSPSSTTLETSTATTTTHIAMTNIDITNSTSSVPTAIAESTTGIAIESIGLDQHQNSESGDFKHWHILLFAIMLATILAIILILVLLVFIKKRRSKKSKAPSPTTFFNGEDVVFENSLYLDVNSRNARMERETEGTQVAPMPSLPAHIRKAREEDVFKPVKPHKESDETQNATAATDVLVKKLGKNSCLASQVAGRLRAESNPYSDFNTLKRQMDQVDIDSDIEEESPYQDLDQVKLEISEDRSAASSLDFVRNDVSPTNNTVLSANDEDERYIGAVSGKRNTNESFSSDGQADLYTVPHKNPKSQQTWVNFKENEKDSSEDEKEDQEDIAKLQKSVKENME